MPKFLQKHFKTYDFYKSSSNLNHFINLILILNIKTNILILIFYND